MRSSPAPASLFVVLTGFVLAAATASAQAVDPLIQDTTGIVRAIAVQPDGKVVLGGEFDAIGGVPRSRIARLNADGTLDMAFDPGANATVNAIAIQPDGKIVIGGDFVVAGGASRFNLARINADGSLDTGFNPGTNGGPMALAIQPDGKILVGGVFTMIGGGTGTTSRSRLARLNADGTVDPGFDPGANLAVYSLALQGDGSMIVGGAFTTIGGGGAGSNNRARLARLDTNGNIDPTFNPGANSWVGVVLTSADGYIYAAGDFTGLGGGSGTTPRPRIGRLLSDGSVDATFNPGADAPIVTMALQADGRLLIGGLFTVTGGGTHNRIARIDASSGSADATFDPGANDVGVFALAIQADGRVLVGGSFTGLGGGTGTTARTNFGRILNTEPALERLSVTGGSVAWIRGVTAPEVVRADFDYSTDGATFTPLGTGVSIAGGWQVTGAVLPADPNLRLRVRGTARGGFQGGTTWPVTIAAPVSGADMMENGSFDGDAASWLTFALPDAAGMTSNVTGGVFQFYRTGTQAVAFQQTGLPVPAMAPLTATFQIGNSDNVRKRISVLVHDASFADLSVCTFWLPANVPLTTYTMRTHTTRTWSDATISFYAASVNAVGNTTGFYLLDNITLTYQPSDTATETTCVDPFVPTPPGGAAGSNLLTNGDFSAGLSPWTLFGQITGSVAGGVFEFVKNAGTPAGVILQATGQAMVANQILTATFQLGNSSAVRKRVTVLIHDNDFTDLSACTFWVAPGQALTTYTYRTFTTKAWTNATFSVYPATVGAAQWIRLDNVTLQRTPGTALTGTLCIEPGGIVPDEAAPPARRPATSPASDSGDSTGDWLADGFEPASDARGIPVWVATADTAGRRVLQLPSAIDLTDAGHATLHILSRLISVRSRAEVQVSADDGPWEVAARVAASDVPAPVAIDLSPYAGQVIRVRFVLTTDDGSEAGQADVWEIFAAEAGD